MRIKDFLTQSSKRAGIAAPKEKYTLWKLAFPIAFESLFQIMFGFADTFVLSTYSDTAVAAVGYVNQILDVLLLLFRVIASGTSILLAQAIGAGKQKEQNQICTAAFYLSLFTGLCASCGVVWGRLGLLRLVKADSALLPYAADYLKVMGAGLIFSSLFTVLTAIYRSSGKAFYTSVISVFSNLLNILGDILVVKGMLHVFGTVQDVALVTVAANGLACFAALLLLLKEQMTFLRQRPDKAFLLAILSLGVPAAGESCSYKCSQLAVTMIVGALGTQTLAAKIYGMNFSRIMVLVPNSIAIAAGILVGVQIGEGSFSRARETASSCIRKGALAILVADIPLLLFGRFLVLAFTHEAEILKMAYLVLVMEAVTMFLKNINLTLGNSLRAAKDVIFPVIVSAASMWLIGTGLAWVLGIFLHMGLGGIFAAFFIDEGIRAFLLYKRWRKKSST
ncbi:MAG: MATE family efflux transporter [Eubacteriales bacterium]|nr:MATE family efflux transporter [Eubacteriales bacterium]